MQKTLCWCGAALVSAGLMSATARADGSRLTAVAGGVDLSRVIVAVAVDSDLVESDAATVTVAAGGARLPKIGEPLEVHALDKGIDAVVFKGEVVGVEPAFDESTGSAVTIRAFNRLHRLTGGQKTRTFENQSDSDIASRIAAENGLAFGPSGPEALTRYDHVYQQNQTDLEFLRARAAGIGYEVVVDDSTLFFQRHREPNSTALGCFEPLPERTGRLRGFFPRLSSANQLSRVTVHGFQPAGQREIVGTSTDPVIPLSDNAAKAALEGRALDLGLVQTLDNEAAAYGAALGTLTVLSAGVVSGEADSDGDASLRAGARITIEGALASFNGDYHIVAASHRFEPASGRGWHTLLRAVRDDRGRFFLPEVGDDVIVAFLEGDPDTPIVIGSLWDRAPPPESFWCGQARSLRRPR